MDNITYRKDTLEDSKLYSFKIEVSLLDWLRKEAEAQKISVSQLIREAIEFYARVKEAKV